MRSVLIGMTTVAALVLGTAGASASNFYKGNFETGERVTLKFVSLKPLKVEYCYNQEPCTTHRVSKGSLDKMEIRLKNGKKIIITRGDEQAISDYQLVFHHAKNREFTAHLFAREE